MSGNIGEYRGMSGNIGERGMSGNIGESLKRGMSGNIGESLKRGISGNLYSNMILPVNFELMKFTG